MPDGDPPSQPISGTPRGVRTVAELIHVEDPRWPSLTAEIAASPVAQLVVADPQAGEHCLHRLQVTAHSTLGAMALHVGLLRIEHGWLRLYGSGDAASPDLASVNGLPDNPDTARSQPPTMTIGTDVMGGSFAINGGGLPGRFGDVHYYAPDTLAWESLELGYTDFIGWALSGRTADFYGDSRWPGWQAEVAAVGADKGLSFYPPLCTAEAKANLAATSRRAVPLQELRGSLRELSALPHGERFSFHVRD